VLYIGPNAIKIRQRRVIDFQAEILKPLAEVAEVNGLIFAGLKIKPPFPSGIGLYRAPKTSSGVAFGACLTSTSFANSKIP
jgi:hypothetical protein